MAERPGDGTPGRRRNLILTAVALLGATLLSTALSAQTAPLPRNNYGAVGLIDMPSARMAPDGEISAGASFFQKTQRYNLGFQILPWLEGSFRYSGLQNFYPSFPVYYDRSFAVKARLWNESDMLPALAVGVNDLVGTGIYAGEYIVASKRLGDFDTTLGMGWGRLGSTAVFSNPLGAVSDAFKTRNPDNAAGGLSNLKALFHGRSVGLFGGIVWHTPIEDLSLLVEYSSDRYMAETDSGNFRPKNQINLGASYQAFDNVSLGLNWVYGRSIGANLSIQLNPKNDSYPQKMGTTSPEAQIRSDEEQRLALETFVRQNVENNARPQVSPKVTASANISAFVEALWRSSDGDPDIRLQGRSLLLVARENRTTCPAMIRLVQAYAHDIDMVTMRGRAGAERNCAMPNAGSIRMTYAQGPGSSPAATVSASGGQADNVTVIDAVSRWPDQNQALDIVRREAEEQKLSVEALSIGESRTTLYYANDHYFAEVDAVDRLTRILMANTPANVETFRLVAVANGVPQREFNILRGTQERELAHNGQLSVLGAGTTVQPASLQNPLLEAATRETYPRFFWEIFPHFRHELFDPNNPFATQFLLAAHGRLSLFPGFSLDGRVESSLFDNFRRDRKSDSVLPHVRSDFLDYFGKGKTGIGNLEADYRFRLAQDVFAVARAGYLESMFAGVGGEVLWRPQGQRWALGVDVYQAWQRDFDRMFGLRDYRVTTGHLSVYYASPWYGLNFIVRGGQYLAGDRGVTLEITRRFSTGVEVGAFMTKTNVPASQFGEGSFDKGIIVRIPIGWFAPLETQGQLAVDLRPVQRDGGQRLDGDALLFSETQRASWGEMLRHAERD